MAGCECGERNGRVCNGPFAGVGPGLALRRLQQRFFLRQGEGLLLLPRLLVRLIWLQLVEGGRGCGLQLRGAVLECGGVSIEEVLLPGLAAPLLPARLCKQPRPSPGHQNPIAFHCFLEKAVLRTQTQSQWYRKRNGEMCGETASIPKQMRAAAVAVNWAARTAKAKSLWSSRLGSEVVCRCLPSETYPLGEVWLE